MSREEDRIRAEVGAVIDPELGLGIGEVGMLRSVRVKKSRVDIAVSLPVSAWPSESALRGEIEAVGRRFDGISEVVIETFVMDDPDRMALRTRLRFEMEGDGDGSEAGHASAHGAGQGGGHGASGHGESQSPTPKFMAADSETRIIGISSGKGGVGKSSLTVNLGIALASAGFSVGILDADVYGFSIPQMIGADHDPVVLGDLVLPTAVHGVRVLSMGFFVPDDQPVIWRGPMLHKAIEQFLVDAYWGKPDFVLVDMPPGTGDVTLTLAQVISRAEIIVVTTPQRAAQRVAQRAAYAARKLKLSVRGVVENMSYFTDDQGKRYELFGSGGGQALADDLGIALLGCVPLVPSIREGCDIGIPVTVSDPSSNASQAYLALGERVASMGPARVYRRELTLR